MSSPTINTERGLKLGYQKVKVPVITRNCRCSQRLRSTSGITSEGFVPWRVLNRGS